MKIKQLIELVILRPLLLLLYLFFYIAARLTNWYFYRKMVFRGREHFKTKNPFIVTPNHPNGIVDVLLAAAYLRYQLFFVANYGLFRHPITGFLLHYLYCIPIKRREDMRQGESRDNSAAFEACDKHLTNKGNLLIAPEGSSWRERHIREIKSGTARIAFSAEIANNWQLGLKIFPVGITYDEKGDFGTSVVMSAEKAIHVADFKAIYEQKPDKAIDELTTKMLQFYDENTINCIDNEEDKMLKKIEYIFDTEKRPLTEGGYERGKKLLHQLRSIKNETLKWTNLQNDIDKYYNVLTEKGLNVPRRSFVNLMLWIIGLPILIYGFLTNGLTWLSCWALQRKLGLHDSYHPTLLYLSGLIFFPTILYLQIKILNYFYDLPFWINIIFAISVFIVGKAAIWLYTEGGILWQRRRYENHPDQKEIELLAEKVKAYFE